MDTCVPSPNLMNPPFAPSPLSYSIFEQDRPSVYCDNSKVNFNLDVCGGVTEETGLLDDNIEDTTLKSLLNSMTSSSSSFDQSGEVPFNPFGVDSDVLFSNILNVDSNDSKFSFPDFDCMTSNPPSSCHTPVTTSEARPELNEAYLAERLGFPARNREITSTSTTIGDNIGQDLLVSSRKFLTMKPNFPPRKTEPPVGVVAPVKIVEDNKNVFDHYPVKREINDHATNFCSDKVEASPQIVPSFTVSYQKTESSPVKLEPASPESAISRECLKRASLDDLKQNVSGDSLAPVKSKRRRFDSGSSGITSEDGDCDDNDFAFHNDYDSDDDDLDADLAHMKPGECESLIGGGKKQKQYFWQYNVQAKGPKGTRLKLAVESPADPHVLNGFEDPVFDEGNTTVAGIRHGGKARKGDGNEVTPNPHKLFKIGHQLLRLNKKINGCQLGSDVPLVQRNEARKEKNKLASRACRLKKKAQHEANKIKLHGLEMEHGQINNVLRLLWPELKERAKYLQNEHHIDEKPVQEDLFSKLNGYITSNLKSMVAGHTTDYVNDVIMTVEKGDIFGGLKVKARKT